MKKGYDDTGGARRQSHRGKGVEGEALARHQGRTRGVREASRTMAAGAAVQGEASEYERIHGQEARDNEENGNTRHGKR